MNMMMNNINLNNNNNMNNLESENVIITFLFHLGNSKDFNRIDIQAILNEKVSDIIQKFRHNVGNIDNSLKFILMLSL